MCKIKLKPCPFCGKVISVERINAPKPIYIHCETLDCPMFYGMNYIDMSSAIKAWNRRAGEQNEID